MCRDVEMYDDVRDIACVRDIAMCGMMREDGMM
jgi:hypothetical protein